MTTELIKRVPHHWGGCCSMISIAQETPRQDEVLDLIEQSDAYSASLYPPENRHPIYIEALSAPEVRFLVARLEGRAVGCGALVLGRDGAAELKRMFVAPTARGRSIGRAILQALEDIARREGVRVIQLETGINNDEALGLYRRFGYREREPFGNYQPDPTSVFM